MRKTLQPDKIYKLCEYLLKSLLIWKSNVWNGKSKLGASYIFYSKIYQIKWTLFKTADRHKIKQQKQKKDLR